MLFLNATDMDRSREYGQESIIYSLEGSSHFRINARSGEPLDVLCPFLFSSLFYPHPSLLSPSQPAQDSHSLRDSPDFRHYHLLSHPESFSFSRGICGNSAPQPKERLGCEGSC